ncbi:MULTISPECIES: hypothetical protein [Burkholderia]|uniref:hypothetical protein n=1 Tax=Burkholderia TaxID=32008 RepID=UPI000F7A8ACA|nr:MULTISPECIES: hypothetical protein [Burkholderia]
MQVKKRIKMPSRPAYVRGAGVFGRVCMRHGARGIESIGLDFIASKLTAGARREIFFAIPIIGD